MCLGSIGVSEAFSTKMTYGAGALNLKIAVCGVRRLHFLELAEHRPPAGVILLDDLFHRELDVCRREVVAVVELDAPPQFERDARLSALTCQDSASSGVGFSSRS